MVTKKDTNIIEGTHINTSDLGHCFKIKAFGEVMKNPVEFLKKLGIFDIHSDGGRMYLSIVHLSYMEFCTAGSLCRT